MAGDPSLDGYSPPGLSLTHSVSPTRFVRRRGLLDAVRAADRESLSAHRAVTDMGIHYRKAFEILGSGAVRKAFDLTLEKEAVRERYGFDRKVDRRKLAREFGGVPHIG